VFDSRARCTSRNPAASFPACERERQELII
jgi:hypothetical protein